MRSAFTPGATSGFDIALDARCADVNRPMTTLTNEQAFAELYYTRKAIKDIIGVTPKCW